jgi:hypothetical protein
MQPNALAPFGAQILRVAESTAQSLRDPNRPGSPK